MRGMGIWIEIFRSSIGFSGRESTTDWRQATGYWRLANGERQKGESSRDVRRGIAVVPIDGSLPGRSRSLAALGMTRFFRVASRQSPVASSVAIVRLEQLLG